MAAKLPVHIRWALRRDMPEILGIERLKFSHPWNEDDFIRYLRQRNCIGMVAESGGRVVGYMLYALYPLRLDLINFAVHPSYEGLGVGRQMAEKLIGKLSQQRRVRIETAVREENLSDRLFFKAMGFTAVEILREWFVETGEDSYLFERRLDVPECDPTTVVRIAH